MADAVLSRVARTVVVDRVHLVVAAVVWARSQTARRAGCLRQEQENAERRGRGGKGEPNAW